MKITEVTTRTFLHRTTSSHDDLGHPIRGPAHDVYESLLTISTDEGAAGYSFGASPNVVDQVISPMLVGNDPFDRERLWQRMAISQGMIRDFHPQELAAVDLALWDLAGRYLGQPIHKLLGAYRDKVPAYASSPLGTFGGGALDTPEAYAELAAACVRRGFKGFKLHTWFPSGPDQELDPKRGRRGVRGGARRGRSRHRPDARLLALLQPRARAVHRAGARPAGLLLVRGADGRIQHVVLPVAGRATGHSDPRTRASAGQPTGCARSGSRRARATSSASRWGTRAGSRRP